MHLARIEDPGGEVTDFGFTENYCKMTGVRDPDTADAVAAGTAPNDATSPPFGVLRVLRRRRGQRCHPSCADDGGGPARPHLYANVVE